ncbi:unnamed protein product [Cryptosporidium hominis]|uniref:Uncharacterized protein n=1 Tax=Cryptosporidium hominis TaxID=237895 RepID=A0A0S4TCZ4_CRYHO|nr:hypothetical protein [Cryptosporidium hominis TU502]OLQ16958.1 hypothetical protein ChTU502y2012_389g0095 [Cryptosporidium hominis]PPA63718.1 hypothetical protein ChUKH1_09240 [Cryptosporidium hominis]CUV04960.1 unnamed protein product [Cryptosporidium hominis]
MKSNNYQEFESLPNSLLFEKKSKSQVLRQNDLIANVVRDNLDNRDKLFNNEHDVNNFDDLPFVIPSKRIIIEWPLYLLKNLKALDFENNDFSKYELENIEICKIVSNNVREKGAQEWEEVQKCEKESIQEHEKELIQEHEEKLTQEYNKELIQEREEEPAQEYEKELIQEHEEKLTQEYNKVPVQEHEKELIQEREEEPAQEYNKEPVQEHEKELIQEREEKLTQEQKKELTQEYNKELFQEHELEQTQNQSQKQNQNQRQNQNQNQSQKQQLTIQKQQLNIQKPQLNVQKHQLEQTKFPTNLRLKYMQIYIMGGYAKKHFYNKEQNSYNIRVEIKKNQEIQAIKVINILEKDDMHFFHHGNNILSSFQNNNFEYHRKFISSQIQANKRMFRLNSHQYKLQIFKFLNLKIPIKCDDQIYLYLGNCQSKHEFNDVQQDHQIHRRNAILPITKQNLLKLTKDGGFQTLLELHDHFNTFQTNITQQNSTHSFLSRNFNHPDTFIGYILLSIQKA